jgi:predicted GTPase
MPYGNLEKQIVQRFATHADLLRHAATIEEREEYEPHVVCGTVVYAGVDYGAILRQAEQEADIVVWDGGNSEVSFYDSNLYIVVTDPLRAGDETTYHPGETSRRLADVVVVNKLDSAGPEGVNCVYANIRALNLHAIVEDAVRRDSREQPRGSSDGLTRQGAAWRILRHGGHNHRILFEPSQTPS